MVLGRKQTNKTSTGKKNKKNPTKISVLNEVIAN